MAPQDPPPARPHLARRGPITSLPSERTSPQRLAESFPAALMRRGLLRPEDLARSAQRPSRISAQLALRGTLSEDMLLDAAADHFAASRVDPLADLPDARLIDRLGLIHCLRSGLLPWRQAGAMTVVVTSRPEEFHRHLPQLELLLGPVAMALAPAARIEAALQLRRGARMAHLAENRVPPGESCRDWGRISSLPGPLLAGALLLAALWTLPVTLLQGLLALAMISLILCTGLKIAAALAALRQPEVPEPGPLRVISPMVSIIVALYRESDIAPRLVRRLSRLDYPRDLLEVVLVVEAEDAVTRDALARSRLPPWMRVVSAPPGRIKTKPRALNIALDHCRGSIIGIYDAEDAPDADQIRRVVDHFATAAPDVACLQGVLDYYNPRTNWLSRCFTVEYAAWFRLILPGVARLGLAVPLGGTTLFFRRTALEELGGWDAHNVTEDADLGIRLVRHGYRTELVATVTQEEANCRPVQWVKQRSRWIKGYMMTWIVHMRDPLLLWRQIGPRRFLGFQVMFLGSILQALLAPLLWSFWLLLPGLPHPLAASLHPVLLWTMITLFLLAEAVTVTLGVVALRRTKHRLSGWWVPTLHLYHPLAALASYKALWELITRPFYWDKTSHGIFDPKAPRRPLR